MSKSLGNGIDPLEVIDQYGADALRFTLVTGISPGQRHALLATRRSSASRNFANKIWNAVPLCADEPERRGRMDLPARWTSSPSRTSGSSPSLNDAVREVTRQPRRVRPGHRRAASCTTSSGSEFCDWYIELVEAQPEWRGRHARPTLPARCCVYVLSSTAQDCCTRSCRSSPTEVYRDIARHGGQRSCFPTGRRSMTRCDFAAGGARDGGRDGRHPRRPQPPR